MEDGPLKEKLPWLLVAFLLCSPALAAGQDDWAATFTAKTLSTHFAKDQRLLVAASGPAGQADAAASALSTGLKQAGVALVMDAAALGDVSELDDRSIVAKALPFPVDAVVVVRVFGGAGEAVTVVAVAYDKAGKVLRSLNGTRGSELAASKPASPPPVYRAPPAAAPPPAGGDEQSQLPAGDLEQRVARYKESYLHFGETLYLNANTGAIVGSRSRPYQGQYLKRLSWLEFFEASGRDDLVDQYKGRRRTKLVLILGGVAVAIGGVPAIAVPLSNQEFCSSGEPGCEESLNVPAIVAGSVMLVGGFTTALVGLFRSSVPIKLSEARRVADEHNRKLRKRLGLGDKVVSAPAPGPQGGWERVSAAPMIGRGTAGFGVSLQLR